MKAWMIYPKVVLDNSYGNNAFEWMVTSAAKYKIELTILFKEDLSITSTDEIRFYEKGQCLEWPDVVIMRCYHYQYNQLFEALGIRVINRTCAMFNTRNKGVASTLLKHHGIETPDFVVDQNISYQEMKKRLNHKTFIVKAIDGSGGEDVYLIKNETEYNTAVNKIYGEFICQEYIESSRGRDIRLYVLGDQVIGGVKRQSKTDFRSNYALGGHAYPIEITEDMATLALDGCKALGVEFAGVDLLYLTEGYTICEINGNAGFRTLSQVTDIDMGNELFRYISKTM